MLAWIIGNFLIFLCCQLSAFEESTKLAEMKVNLSEISFQRNGMYYLSKNHLPIPIVLLRFEDGQYIAFTPKGIIEDFFGVV